MADVFTLAHELGHAGHFRLCNGAQAILDTEVSSYFVEAPSTMNELLMAHYLLKTTPDKRFRRWVLSCMISNTYYHNFVTHLMEAAYQREVYKLIDAGDSVQAETLSSIMKETLQKFWSDDVEISDDAALTWDAPAALLYGTLLLHLQRRTDRCHTGLQAHRNRRPDRCR